MNTQSLRPYASAGAGSIMGTVGAAAATCEAAGWDGACDGRVSR